jgi:hypothetical protein
MLNPQWGSHFERLCIALSMAAVPQPRLEQIRLKVDRLFLRLPRPSLPRENVTVPPVVVGARGGSGTRALTEVLRKAGWFMGNRVDTRNQDSLPIACFLSKWLRRLIDYPEVEDQVLDKAKADFERAVHLHRAGIPSPDAPWGWKNPRTVWILPFIADCFPQMRFIHMVRDPRDMALSQNRSFLKDHGSWLLGSDWWRDITKAQFELWRRGNGRVLSFAAEHLRERYHIIRYEDFCQRPAETVSALLKFLGNPDVNIEPLIGDIKVAGNIGRWRRAAQSDSQKLAEEMPGDLQSFGYQTQFGRKSGSGRVFRTDRQSPLGKLPRHHDG